MTPDQSALKGEHMSEAEVNWRDLKEGERVKVEFEATVVNAVETHGLLTNWEGFRFSPKLLDAAKITRIERPWKVGDRFKSHNGEVWTVRLPPEPHPRESSRSQLVCRGDASGFWPWTGAELRTVTRLEPSDDR